MDPGLWCLLIARPGSNPASSKCFCPLSQKVVGMKEPVTTIVWFSDSRIVVDKQLA